MSGGREAWAHLRSLFEAAREVPADRRDSWLSEHVEDPALRQEVARLVTSHEREGPFDALTGALAALGAGAAPADATPVRVGAYLVDELLGEGGTARVYAARREGDASAARVAIKVLRADTDSARVRRRFLAEREIVAGLRHQGIARFIDAGFTPGGDPYLVTEYVDGRPIDRYVEEEGLDIAARIGLFLEVCDAVEAAHALGVVHRDLKPGNVLVDSSGRVRLLDFGIAKVLDGAAFPELRRKTSAGVRLLTIRYASPEQLVGGEITAASDVYQLGLLLHRILLGSLPRIESKFGGSAPSPKAGRSSSGHESGAGLPPVLAPVLARALEPSASERHASAGTLAEAVRDAMEQAGRPGMSGRLRRWLGLTRT